MNYRQLNAVELSRIVEELQTYQVWEAYRDYARDIYGPYAERIVITTELNQHYDCESYITVYDSQGLVLDPDFSTPWWRESLQPYDMRRANLEIVIPNLIDGRKFQLPPCKYGYGEYSISAPPRMQRPTLFVAVPS